MHLVAGGTAYYNDKLKNKVTSPRPSNFGIVFRMLLCSYTLSLKYPLIRIHQKTMSKSLPKFVYKYRNAKIEKTDDPEASSLTRLQRMIEHGEIYFGSSFEFNDPFDCRPVVTLDCSDEKFVQSCVEAARAKHGERGAVLMESHIQSTLGTPEDLRHPSNLVRLEKLMANRIAEDGVFCAAERPDNILMWSHYAENFTGVCLEIDTDEFEYLAEVNYCRERPVINLLPFGDSPEVQVDKALFSKFIVWNYEEEWRAMSRKGVGTLSEQGITRIIFGQNCGQPVREILMGYVKNSGKRIQLAEVRPDSRSYRLNIVDL